MVSNYNIPHSEIRVWLYFILNNKFQNIRSLNTDMNYPFTVIVNDYFDNIKIKVNIKNGILAINAIFSQKKILPSWQSVTIGKLANWSQGIISDIPIISPSATTSEYINVAILNLTSNGNVYITSHMQIYGGWFFGSYTTVLY